MTIEEIKQENKKEKVKFKLNIWMIATAVLALLLIITFFSRGGVTGNIISSQEAGSETLRLINEYFIKEGSATLLGIEEESGLYKVNLVYRGQDTPVYMSKDGKYLIMPNGIVDIAQLESLAESTSNQEETESSGIQKTDKPKVELFVMTHCPYGTQAAKGIIPVLEMLENKIDGKIRFVHYFMHGDEEEKETYRQVCIREEQGSKFIPYLKCFLEAGDGEECLNKLEVDSTMLDSCIEEKVEEYYAEDSSLSEQYGVRGSPTLVINGVIASSGRSPAAYLTTICSAFNIEPGACKEVLSSNTPSPGFGYSGSGSGSGSC